jgi:hypothetical protein
MHPVWQVEWSDVEEVITLWIMTSFSRILRKSVHCIFRRLRGESLW